MKTYLISLISLLIILSYGCNSQKDLPKTNDYVTPNALSIPVSKIEDITTRIKPNNNEIDSLSKNISEMSLKAISINPKISELPIIKSNADKITFVNTENIKNINVLDTIKTELIDSSKQIELLKRNIEELKSENNVVKLELQKGMNKILLLTYGLCILGITGGVILMFFNQQNNGIIVICVSVAMLGLIYFLQTYAWLLGIVSGTMFIGLLGLCVYKIYCDQKTKLELVQSFEKVKNATQYTEKEKLAVTNIQSDSTINEVQTIKKAIGL
jgi:hypothetical protein